MGEFNQQFQSATAKFPTQGNREFFSPEQGIFRLNRELTGNLRKHRRQVRDAADPTRRRAYIPEVPKLRGDGETTCGPDAVTRSTASPRSLVPSWRKRNSPSMPVKPDGLVSTCGENRCAASGCVFTKAATR